MENDTQAIITVTKNGSSDYFRMVRLTGIVENEVDITQNLTFSPEETVKEVSIPVIDDEIALEEPIQYPLSLQIPTGQTGVEVGEQPNSALEVGDNDGKLACSYSVLIACNKYVWPSILIEPSRSISLTLFLVFTLQC